MIATWEEINSRYNAIKDHKPRASKKLKELGEILASAYKLDPQRADEMWQYIIELNIQDDITFSKFYIAQVFNKLTDILSLEEAISFASMRPERVCMMLIYGFDGGTLIRVAYTIIGGQLLEGRLDEGIDTLSILEEKYTTTENLNKYALYSVFNSLCRSLEEKKGKDEYTFRYDIPTSNVIAFYEICCRECEDEYIRAVAKARVAMLKQSVIQDTDSVRHLFHYLSEASAHTNYELTKLFTDFLFFERDVIGDGAEEVIYDYCIEAGFIRLPIVAYGVDEKLLVMSNWYRSIVSHSERILCELFGKQQCQDFLKNVLHSTMYESDWRTFLKYLVLGLNQESEYGAASYLEFVQEEIREYSSMKGKTIKFEDGTWWLEIRSSRPTSTTNIETSFGSIEIYSSFSSRRSIEKPRVTEENVHAFIKALARACVLTSGALVNEQLVDEVRSFATKETGSVDALAAVGMEVEPDNRSEMEKFCDFAEKQISQRARYDNSYNQRKEVYNFIQNIESETGTYGIETGKLLAKQPQILSFLFLHDAHSFTFKPNIILGALLDDNYPAAFKCIDYMIETAKYPNFSERNSWSMEMKNTLSNLLCDVFRKNSSDYEEPYSDGVTSAVIQIAEKCLPYLGGDEANEVKANLVRLKPEEDDQAMFIQQLLEIVDAYTSGKKPTGYSKYINNTASEILQGVEVLSNLNRMDVVAQILLKLMEGRKNIAGPTYDAWMTRLLRLRVTDEQRLELYALIPDVYSAYIEASDQKMALSLLETFGRLGDLTVYKTLRDQVMQKHGYIEGMNSCFHYSENTATPITLCANNVYQVSLLYWNASFNILSGIYSAEVVLRVKNETGDYISLYASNVMINGIPLQELKKDGKERSNREHICYYLGRGEESVEHLRLFWGNQREYSIKELFEISFSLIAQNGEKEIAQSGQHIIQHDPKSYAFVLKT